MHIMGAASALLTDIGLKLHGFAAMVLEDCVLVLAVIIGLAFVLLSHKLLMWILRLFGIGPQNETLRRPNAD